MVSRSCGRGAVRPRVVECTASSIVTESLLPELVCEPRTNPSSAPQNHPEGADSPASPPPEEHQQMPPQMTRLIPLYPSPVPQNHPQAADLPPTLPLEQHQHMPPDMPVLIPLHPSPVTQSYLQVNDYPASPPPEQNQQMPPEMPRLIPLHPLALGHPVDAEDACLKFIGSLQQLRHDYEQAKEHITNRFYNDIFHVEYRWRHQPQ